MEPTRAAVCLFSVRRMETLSLLLISPHIILSLATRWLIIILDTSNHDQKISAAWTFPPNIYFCFFPGFLRRCVETSRGNANPHSDRAQRGSDRDFTSRNPCRHLLLWLYGKDNRAKKRLLSFDQRVANCDKTTKKFCQVFAKLTAVNKLS